MNNKDHTRRFGFRLFRDIERSVTSLYIIFLYSVIAYYLFSWPVVAQDTDLWYHLNSGRYFFENRTIPHDSFFSFITPPREWTDYYWLFQVLIYKIYSFSGYYGLIVLRATLYLLTASLVLLYLLKNTDSRESNLALYFVVIISLYFMFLVGRYQNIRPHTFTYLFIVLYLYILEFKSDKTFYLPLLSILWVNLHGIVYPVILIITLSYCVEFFIKRLKDRVPFTRERLLFIASLVVAMWCIFLTPHGQRLIKVPLISTEYASLYIKELQPIRLQDLTWFVITLNSLDFNSIFKILIVIALLAGIRSFLKKQIRISHLLMFGGGIILLMKGVRFTYECLLLSMPLIKANPIVSATTDKKIYRPYWITLIVVLVAMTLLFLKTAFPEHPRYPFSERNLPVGVVAFLKHIDTGGSVLNFPNSGGYLQWELYPRYKIFMDMEVPFLFTDEDFFVAKAVYSNKEALQKVVSKYNPSFITVPIENKFFKEIIKALPYYSAVFFDDTDVLYVNRNLHPDIARQYELKAIDPFTIVGKDLGRLSGPERKLILEELLRISGIYPDSYVVNQLIAIIYNLEGNYNESLRISELIIKNYPELPVGYILRGNALMDLERFNEAILSFKKALKKGGEREDIYRALWKSYVKLKQYKKAYKVAKKAFNFFSPNLTFEDLYNLSLTALHAGKTDEALMLLKFSLLKVPPDNYKWKQEIQDQISKFTVEDEKDKEIFMLQ